jgi:DNA-binding NarL/FixJ family response regulator
MQVNDVAAPTRVGVVSTEPIRLAGLTSVFENHPTIYPVPADLEELLADTYLRYLVLDVSHNPGWMEILFLVRRLRPDLRPIILGPAGNDELVLRSIKAGARGYLDSNAGPLAVRQAVEVVIRGSIWAPRRLLSTMIDRLLTHSAPTTDLAAAILSPRERQVLTLIMTARSNREIAEELGIEERTVKAHVTSLMRKTGAENRVSLSVQATQHSMRETRSQSL